MRAWGGRGFQGWPGSWPPLDRILLREACDFSNMRFRLPPGCLASRAFCVDHPDLYGSFAFVRVKQDGGNTLLQLPLSEASAGSIVARGSSGQENKRETTISLPLRTLRPPQPAGWGGPWLSWVHENSYLWACPIFVSPPLVRPEVVRRGLVRGRAECAPGGAGVSRGGLVRGPL